MTSAQTTLHKEVERLNGTGLVVSTNLRVKIDGMLYAADMNKKIEDPGVAVYFKYKGKDTSMCCDQYERVWENIYALAKSIEALRSIERWGVSDFLNKAFTGFTALPSPELSNWWTVLGIMPFASLDQIKQAYKDKAKMHHPDTGGDVNEFHKIQRAYETGLQRCGVNTNQ
jgi:hypothetical protein